MHGRERPVGQACQVRVLYGGRTVPCAAVISQLEILIFKTLEEHIDHIVLRPGGLGRLGLRTVGDSDVEGDGNTCRIVLDGRGQLLGAGHQSRRKAKVKQNLFHLVPDLNVFFFPFRIPATAQLQEAAFHPHRDDCHLGSVIDFFVFGFHCYDDLIVQTADVY